jgi:hypothetical protein
LFMFVYDVSDNFEEGNFFAPVLYFCFADVYFDAIGKF